MRSINVDTSIEDNANCLDQNTHAASPEPCGNDYLDNTLQKEIALWFKKSSSSGNNVSINEPGNTAQKIPDVIHLHHNNF